VIYNDHFIADIANLRLKGQPKQFHKSVTILRSYDKNLRRILGPRRMASLMNTITLMHGLGLPDDEKQD